MNHGLPKISQKWVSAIDHFVLALGELRSLPRLGYGGMGTLQAARLGDIPSIIQPGGNILQPRKNELRKKDGKSTIILMCGSLCVAYCQPLESFVLCDRATELAVILNFTGSSVCFSWS
jgi:hypothetical protein